MKKFFLLFILFSFLITGIALAQVDELSAEDVVGILDNLALFVLSIAGGIMVIFVVIYGIKISTAGGNVDQLQSAKKGLLWSVIGALVIFGTGVIINTVRNITSDRFF